MLLSRVPLSGPSGDACTSALQGSRSSATSAQSSRQLWCSVAARQRLPFGNVSRKGAPCIVQLPDLTVGACGVSVCHAWLTCMSFGGGKFRVDGLAACTCWAGRVPKCRSCGAALWRFPHRGNLAMRRVRLVPLSAHQHIPCVRLFETSRQQEELLYCRGKSAALCAGVQIAERAQKEA